MARKAAATRRRKRRPRSPSVLVTAVAIAATALLVALAVQRWPRRGSEGRPVAGAAAAATPAEDFSTAERQALDALLRGGEPNARP